MNSVGVIENVRESQSISSVTKDLLDFPIKVRLSMISGQSIEKNSTFSTS
jgi:hypothetical protein